MFPYLCSWYFNGTNLKVRETRKLHSLRVRIPKKDSNRSWYPSCLIAGRWMKIRVSVLSPATSWEVKESVPLTHQLFGGETNSESQFFADLKAKIIKMVSSLSDHPATCRYWKPKFFADQPAGFRWIVLPQPAQMKTAIVTNTTWRTSLWGRRPQLNGMLTSDLFIETTNVFQKMYDCFSNIYRWFLNTDMFDTKSYQN